MAGQGQRANAITLSRSMTAGIYGAYLSPFKAVFEEWAFEAATTPTARLKVWSGSAWL